jgi:hypothetical protein
VPNTVLCGQEVGERFADSQGMRAEVAQPHALHVHVVLVAMTVGIDEHRTEPGPHVATYGRTGFQVADRRYRQPPNLSHVRHRDALRRKTDRFAIEERLQVATYLLGLEPLLDRPAIAAEHFRAIHRKLRR